MNNLKLRCHEQCVAHRSFQSVPLRVRTSAPNIAALCSNLQHGVRSFAGRQRSARFVRLVVRAEPESNDRREVGLAPGKPKTPYGEMLQYYLKMEPQLFKTAVEDQLCKLKDDNEEKESKQRTLEENQSEKDSTELALFKRMEEVRLSEARNTLEDLMYVSVLEKFVVLGVEMLPRLDGMVDSGAVNLKALTEAIHSREALELVREHLMGIMGQQANTMFSNVPIKMAKFQMAQVYAASIMFGYFLRRVDGRFQLEKQLGTLPASREEAVERLNRLFAKAETIDEAGNPDWVDSSVYEINPDSPMNASSARGSEASEASSSSTGSSTTGSSSGSGSSSSSMSNSPLGSPDASKRRRKTRLREYVESFDQSTVVEMARIVSQEGASLVERQTSALFGDIKKLTGQMQEAVGEDISSMEQVMERMREAISNNKVETLTMTQATQRRAVLEAVAFGSFLRDVETWVHNDYGLLTPLPAPRLPPHMGGEPPLA